MEEEDRSAAFRALATPRGRLAHSASDPGRRAALLAMGQRWLELGDQPHGSRRFQTLLKQLQQGTNGEGIGRPSWIVGSVPRSGQHLQTSPWRLAQCAARNHSHSMAGDRGARVIPTRCRAQAANQRSCGYFLQCVTRPVLACQLRSRRRRAADNQAERRSPAPPAKDPIEQNPARPRSLRGRGIRNRETSSYRS